MKKIAKRNLKVFFTFCVLASTLSCEVSATILPIIKAVETTNDKTWALEFTKGNNPMLRTPCSEVEIFDGKLGTFLDDRIETMDANGGAGLAVNQVNRSIQVFVVRFTAKGASMEFINTTITHKEGEQECHEGCLSIPGYRVTITRPFRVKGYAFDRRGKKFSFDATGSKANVICHEQEHSKGILNTDNASKIEFD
ncbi:hypothetical protein FACS1894198_2670 [Clostridia bacterium]|nr:hypothetical protein FACS1894198_2670 [Clostridia bacterium]